MPHVGMWSCHPEHVELVHLNQPQRATASGVAHFFKWQDLAAHAVERLLHSRSRCSSSTMCLGLC